MPSPFEIWERIIETIKRLSPFIPMKLPPYAYSVGPLILYFSCQKQFPLLTCCSQSNAKLGVWATFASFRFSGDLTAKIVLRKRVLRCVRTQTISFTKTWLARSCELWINEYYGRTAKIFPSCFFILFSDILSFLGLLYDRGPEAELCLSVRCNP